MIGIIPAAGKGTRFKELGKQYSKTILPYKEKPILIHQIEWLENNGCNDIRVVVNHQEESIKNTLYMYNKTGIKIVRQEEQNGLSGAVFCALEKNYNDNVLVLLGDLVAKTNISNDLKDHNFISVQRVPDYSRWCMVDADVSPVKFYDKVSERPPTNLAVSGIYHFTSSALLRNLLKEQLKNDSNKINNEFQLSTVLQEIANDDDFLIIETELIDFGTLEEYLENRSVKISRSFNDITINGNIVNKSSELEREKIIKEYNWFNNLPTDIKIHTPRIFEREFFLPRTWYNMEKVLCPSLREVYLFMDSSKETWDNIFNSMFDLLKKMEFHGQQNSFMKTVVDKTIARVNDIDIPVENKLIKEFIAYMENTINNFSRPALMHGDFCFSNLLYDFQSSKVIMIDPRGELFGDHYYEVAKIAHSVLFDYDFVDAELYYVVSGKSYLYNKGKEEVKETFMSYLDKYYSKQEQEYIFMITASLFLSMIPLHKHNRYNQEMYYEIFKRIFNDIKEGTNAFSTTRRTDILT